MKAGHLIKNLGGSVLVAAVLGFSSSANADVVTQLIHFDDANNGWKWYSDVDNNFLFDPTNLQSSVLCADSTNGGNGSCVIEGGQTVLPTMTRPENGPTSQGSPNRAPDTSGAALTFTLDSFYFLLTGRGEFGGNYIEVVGSNGVTTMFALGGIYANVTSYETGGAAGALDWNTGYIVTLGDTFKDVTSVQWIAYGSAQVRLDCVVATFDGSTTEPLSGFDTGCGSSRVPEPGSALLLGFGLLGLALRRRMRVFQRGV